MTKILIFSDIHKDWEQLKKILEQENNIDLFICAGDWSVFQSELKKGIKLMANSNKPVWIIPGNNETIEDIEFAEKEHGLISFQGKVLIFNGLKIGGIGFSPPTPFGTPGEKDEEFFKQTLKNEFIDKAPLDIFVTHTPPFDTSLDLTNSNLHVGCKAIKDYILSYKPKFSFHGHVHEREGTEEIIKETKSISIGKNGYILSI